MSPNRYMNLKVQFKEVKCIGGNPGQMANPLNRT